MAGLFQTLHHAFTVQGLRRLLPPVAAALPAVNSLVPNRLLYVAASCRPYHISGYTSRTHELLCALQAVGADLRVITRAGYPWDRTDSLDVQGGESTMVGAVQYEHVRRPRNNCFTAIYAARAAKVIVRYARQHRVVRIHAASNHVNALPALIAARRLGLPFQYEMRGLWELTRAARQPEFENSYNYNLGLELEGLVATEADRVFVISEQLGLYAQQQWGISAERMRLLPNCVDGERIKPDPACEVMADTIGYAGSLINYEGLDTLIEALHMLLRQGKGVRLHIIGDGEARPALEAQVNALSLQNYVRFFGKTTPEEARAHILRCALVCIPRKAFTVCKVVPPIKLVEALALGKPVIVPDLPVFRDEAAAGAIFFAPGDAADLARVLADTLGAPPCLDALGQAGRQQVLARRQWEYFVGDLLS